MSPCLSPGSLGLMGGYEAQAKCWPHTDRTRQDRPPHLGPGPEHHLLGPRGIMLEPLKKL